MSEELVRLSKLMSQRGLCSRREADRLIEQGLVWVNGDIVQTLGIKFPESVQIELTQKAQNQQARRISIMFHKPVGVVSGQAEDGYTPAIRLIKASNQAKEGGKSITLNSQHLKGLAPAGRLDIDSTGLLVLTQDGRVAKKIIGERVTTEKEYLVRVNQVASQSQLESLRGGLSLDGKPLKPAKAEQINPQQLKIILTEGKKRQIRRMCEAVGLHVHALKRVRIGRLKLGKLKEGEWRVFDPSEL